MTLDEALAKADREIERIFSEIIAKNARMMAEKLKAGADEREIRAMVEDNAQALADARAQILQVVRDEFAPKAD